MPFYAHSGAKPDLSDGQLLKDHLEAVAVRARLLAAEACPGDAVLQTSAYAAGLLHDLGKYQTDWQQFLKDAVAKKPAASVPHAVHGAAQAAYVIGHQALCLAVLGHHAGLADRDKAWNDLESRHPSLAPLVSKLVESARTEVPGLPDTTADHPLDADDTFSCRNYEFWTRVLFSILVDADRLDTERFATKQDRPRVELSENGPGPTAEGLLNLLDAERQRRAAGKSGKLADLRNQVYKECANAGKNEPQGFFELTVPTGGAKTFAGMAFALAHARRHKLRRVIVVIPYLSIIEQNAREYRQVFGSDVVIEHHSAVASDGPVTESRAVRTPAELATENWDAPIIVTTSVQFLETLLAASPRRCRKLHNIARSVVLFDEAQAMPAHILNPLLSTFRELKSNYGVSFLFSTATQPAFRQSGGLTEGLRPGDFDKPGELQPILRKELTHQLYKDLQRVNYLVDLDARWSWDNLVNRLVETPQALCVLNTRANVRTVWELLRQRVRTLRGDKAADAVIHLSSAMCAQHRMDVLGPKDSYLPGSVRDRLRRQLPCWLVSTQAIEAGVDVDFPRVFRALGPLDAVVQAGGRCNREGLLRDPTSGELQMGEVFVFQPEEAGMPRGFYEAATGEARTMLGEITAEQLATDPNVFSTYFTTIYGRISTDVAPKGERPLQEMRAEFLFRSVAERAKVIKDGGTAVIVPYRKAVPILKKIREVGFYSRRTVRQLQRFLVNLRPNDLLALQGNDWISPLLPEQKDDGPLVLDPAAYDERLGVVIVDRAPEDFIF